MLKKIRYIGIMVEEFERALERFKGFGLSCTETKEIKEIGAKIAFFYPETAEGVLIELCEV